MNTQSITIVGFSLAGLRCAETLRRLGHTGSIHVVGDESEEPYDRPPLSKEGLAGDGDPRVALRKEPIDELDLDVHLGRRAVALDVAARAVDLDNGTRIGAEHVVIATGARARRLPASICSPELANVHVVRTLADGRRLRSALDAEPNRVVVVGAGFIGMEVAASCRARGHEVTVIEPLAQPMVRGLGETIGGACAQLHRDHGVDLRLGTGVAAIDATGVETTAGERLAADVVVVGVGAAPNVEWLESSGLTIDNGVVCDASLAAAPGVDAIGDVARFPNPLFDGEMMRLEHWTNAAEMAMHVAQRIATEQPNDFAPVPFVWSDQYDVKIQSVGRYDSDCDLHVAHGALADHKFVALFGRNGRLVGALGFSQPRFVMQYRRMIAERASWSDAIDKSNA